MPKKLELKPAKELKEDAVIPPPPLPNQENLKVKPLPKFKEPEPPKEKLSVLETTAVNYITLETEKFSRLERLEHKLDKLNKKVSIALSLVIEE